MEQTFKQKQLAFLEETIAHYNMNNRCSKEGSCRYSPVTLDLQGKSEGCAIGRHLDPVLAKELDVIGGTVASASILLKLPRKLIFLGSDFLYQIQALHDSAEYWNATGLSPHGKNMVETLKEQFGL